MGEIRKSVVSVTDMAKMVGLSRQRFAQLVKAGTFPSPDRDPTSKRPFYDATKQQQCLMVRQSNTGIDGRPILFYARRIDAGLKKAVPKKPNADDSLREALDMLGVHVSQHQIDAAIKVVFNEGVEKIDFDRIVKGLFLHFRSKNPTDTQGR